MTLYIVGRAEPENHPHAWEFIGAFEDVEQAVAACKTDQHFIGPVVLNDVVDSQIPWPSGWWPKLQERPA